jgi:tetratricopeptide (TPR) repeat protein
MALAEPDPKLKEYADQLVDEYRPLAETDLRRILKDLDSMLQRGVDHATAGILFSLRAWCYWRLDKLPRALDEYRLALQRLREPTALRASALCNQAGLLNRLGRHAEAVKSSIEGLKIGVPSGHHLALGNLAEALHGLGEVDLAHDVFEDALDAADRTQPGPCFTMAVQAAVLGLDQEAVELFARYLARSRGIDLGDEPAVKVARTATEEEKAPLRFARALDAAIRRMVAMADESARLSSQDADGDDAEASAVALDVYEATRRLREAAVAHVLLEAEDHRAETGS